jgi:hypothetical protein
MIRNHRSNNSATSTANNGDVDIEEEFLPLTLPLSTTHLHDRNINQNTNQNQNPTDVTIVQTQTTLSPPPPSSSSTDPSSSSPPSTTTPSAKELQLLNQALLQNKILYDRADYILSHRIQSLTSIQDVIGADNDSNNDTDNDTNSNINNDHDHDQYDSYNTNHHHGETTDHDTEEEMRRSRKKTTHQLELQLEDESEAEETKFENHTHTHTYPFHCSFDQSHSSSQDTSDPTIPSSPQPISSSSTTQPQPQPSQPPRRHSQQKLKLKQPPVIYAHQREVIHVSNTQYCQKGAVLVTDGATTCHVLALRSTSTRSNNSASSCTSTSTSTKNHMNEKEKESQKRILGSLCHLDSSTYNTCLEKMFLTHVEYHSHTNHNVNVNNNETNNIHVNNDNKITMEIHLIGGYNDSKNTSLEISHSILSTLQTMSNTYQHCMTCILDTCVISSLNDITTYTTGTASSGLDDILDGILEQKEDYQSHDHHHHHQTTHQQQHHTTSNTTPMRRRRGRGLSISTSASSLSSYDTNNTQTTRNSTTWSCHEYYTPPSPIVRGMALDVNSGKVQLINTVDSSLWGPEATLRRVRLWGGTNQECDNDGDDDDNEDDDNNGMTLSSSATSSKPTPLSTVLKHNFNSLLEVHTYEKDQIYIPPFHFQPFENIDLFYNLQDDVMLSLASTSPDVEDEDFCIMVRECCYFLMNVRVESIFGSSGVEQGRKALIYDYDGDGWWDRVY